MLKPLHQTTEADLVALVTDAIPEGLQLDFKRELNLSTDRNRLALANDVAAMANSAGGRIVFGIDEKIVGGAPVAGSLAPLTNNPGVSTLANILHSIIDPPPGALKDEHRQKLPKGLIRLL